MTSFVYTTAGLLSRLVSHHYEGSTMGTFVLFRFSAFDVKLNIRLNSGGPRGGGEFRCKYIFLPDNGAFFVNYVVISALIGTALSNT